MSTPEKAEVVSVEGRLASRHAVVTGAAGGIGAAVATVFARAGALVTMSDLDAGRLEALSTRLEHDPAVAGRVSAVPCDIRKRPSVEAMLAEARRVHGPIDIVASIAGTAWHAGLHVMTDADYDEMMDVHVRGAFHLLRGVVEEFRERRSGKFIGVTSPAAARGQAHGTAYSAAKSAIIGIVRSAALELAPYGVQVNAILPMAATPMTEAVLSDPATNEQYLRNVPLRRWGSPEEIALGFLYLASAEADYVTGIVLPIDGGRII